MEKVLAVVGLGVVIALAVFAVPFLDPDSHKPPPGYQGLRFLSQTAQAGYSPYAARCAECHGYGGEGTEAGPALNTAELAGDFRDRPAFHRAVQRGVAAHQDLLGSGPNFNQVELMAKFLREARLREARNRE